MKKVIITGLTGQARSYLADKLLDECYEVHGIIRRVSTPNYKNILHILDNPKLHIEDGDITDLASLVRIFKRVQPDMIFNLAAQSFVSISWDQPILTSNVTGLGALNVFEAARQACPKTRIFQASSSELFDGRDYPQTETTPFKPRSPYGISKLFAHEAARIYKESFDMFICCGIMFNYTSPRRGIEFITQKVVDTVVRQICGEDIVLELGNLESKRDWSHAKDIVDGMVLMLQQDYPDNFILCSGETHSIFELVNTVYKYFGIDIIWLTNNKTNLPMGIDSEGRTLVKSVEKYYRPSEVDVLLGDPSMAKEVLGWRPKFNFGDIIADMISGKLNEYYKGGE